MEGTPEADGVVAPLAIAREIDEGLLEPGRTSTIAALASREFRIFWVGWIVSSHGLWMQVFGQGYLVVQLAVRDGVPHLAPLYLGLVGLFRAVPGVTFTLFGGAVADRSDRRRLLLATQIAGSAVAGALAVLTITDQINIMEILLLGALSSLVGAFEYPTRQSIVPNLVERQHLSSAVGLSSAAFNGAQLIGPLLGGLLYVRLGVGGLFALNSLTYLAVVAAVMRMGPITSALVPPEGSVLRSIREGLTYIRQDPMIRWAVMLTGAVAVLARPYPQLLPAVTEQVLHVGAVELSWLMAASGAGSLVGSVVIASLGATRRRGPILVASSCALGVALAAFAMQRTLMGALPLLAVIGFAALMSQGMSMMIMQLRTPDDLRGRVMSVHVTVMLGVVPLGVMVLGSLGTLVGVDISLLVGGIVLAGLALFAGAPGQVLRRS